MGNLQSAVESPRGKGCRGSVAGHRRDARNSVNGPAREQFEALQAINPDDLTAHYYLSLIYRQLGMQPEADREGALYSEHKGDSGAALLALYWRDKHPEIARENQPYHVHTGGLK